MILDHLQHAGRAETRHDLGILVLAAGLGQVDGMAKNVFDILRHRIEVTLGGTDPLDGFAGLLRHPLDYACLGIIPQTHPGPTFFGGSGSEIFPRGHISALMAPQWVLGSRHTGTKAETAKNQHHIG